MFKCPQCGGDARSVRLHREGAINRRERKCDGCGFKFTTEETVDYNTITGPDGKRYVCGMDWGKDGEAVVVLCRREDDGSITIVKEVKVDWAEAQRRCKYCKGLGRPQRLGPGKWVHAHMYTSGRQAIDCEAPEIHEALHDEISAPEDPPA